MNTHEQFVSLETAKLLKQAGFDWECNHRYSEGHSTNDSEPIYISPRDDWNQDKGCYSAPTQAVAQRWLREVKDKLIMLDFCTAEPNKFMAIITDTKFPVSSTAVTTDKWSDTYEAALEAGLQKCLTLLIEKQQ